MWPQTVVREILKIPLGQTNLHSWLSEPTGQCNYEALFKFLQPRSIGPQFPWKVVWKLEVLPKLWLFAWRLLLDKLLTRARLARWDSSISPLCLICQLEDETVEHMFIRCTFAQKLWFYLPFLIRRPVASSSFTHWYRYDAFAGNRRLGITCFGIFGKLGICIYSTTTHCAHQRS